jgi:hypothetical protein
VKVGCAHLHWRVLLMPESNFGVIADGCRAFDSADFTVVTRFFDPAIVINRGPKLPWSVMAIEIVSSIRNCSMPTRSRKCQ